MPLETLKTSIQALQAECDALSVPRSMKERLELLNNEFSDFEPSR